VVVPATLPKIRSGLQKPDGKAVRQAEEISGTVLNGPLKQAERAVRSAREALLAARRPETRCPKPALAGFFMPCTKELL